MRKVSFGQYRSARVALYFAALSGLVGCGGGGGGGGGNSAASPSIAPLVWSRPGGNATVAVDSSSPFMQLAPGVDASEMAGVSQGRELFVAEWQAAPGPRQLLDGLGPLFNANACTACHVSNGRAAVLAAGGGTTAAVLFRLGNAAGQEHPVYGGQLQSFATTGQAEGTVGWLSDAATGAINYVLQLAGLPRLDGYHLGPRISPQLVGMGLLDLVPEAQILEYADAADANADGVSGRPHWLTPGGAPEAGQLGRFGWKAIHATLRAQSAGALHQDMGLTTSVHPQENCSTAQAVCGAAPNGGAPEVSDASLAAVVDFMTVLAVPERRVVDQVQFDQGARLFDRAGCVACHRPTLQTGSSQQFPTLSGQTIYAYTDLLLHDMGAALSDGIREKNANPQEWRTPPLWGLGLVEQQASARFLHDGRAKTIAEAIGWHGGEAQKSRDAYASLSDAERKAFLLFLRGI